jgi:hypothetical protein
VNTVGELGSGGGPDGLIYLYQLLHAANNNWYLVPPLKTVNRDIHAAQYTETVGFFYRADRFNFIGPWVWPAAQVNIGPSVPPGVNTANYPHPWDGMLPANTQYASQARFFNQYNQEILFPNANDRRPVLSSFQQIGGNQTVYKIFACHTTPTVNAATATATILGQIREGFPGMNEVVVFAGDFNVDNLDGNGNAFYRAVPGNYYADVVLGAVGGPTTTKRVPDAQPTNYLKTSAYDNFFVRVRRQPLNYFYAPGTYNAVVIDRTAGSVRFPSDMFTPLTSYSPQMGQFNIDLNFHLSVNYGHIGNHHGTSDHLAIIADI